MKETRETRFPGGRRVLVAVLAVVLVMALTVGAMAAAGIFSMNIREAEPEEQFAGPAITETGKPFYWSGAKLVFSFDGPETCSRIRFRPTEMPYNANSYFSISDGDGWYSRISCEGENGGGRSNQPCRIDVRYAPMFVDGGSLLLLYADDVTGIEEEDWDGCRVYKFRTHKEFSNNTGTHYVDCSYLILHQPEQGYVITLSSMEDNLDTLEQIARGLEIEPTGETVSAADWHGHNEFLDCGVG